MKENEKKGCFQCKVICVVCLTGIGGYLIKTAQQQNGNAKILLTGLGLGSICLGIGEIFNKSPFR